MPASIIAFPAPRVVAPAVLRPQPHTRTFDDAGLFAATSAAERLLKTRGFSIGTMQGVMPRGIRFGQCAIYKWDTLAPSERAQLHGKLTGDIRHGPVTVEIFASAPSDAIAAFLREA